LGSSDVLFALVVAVVAVLRSTVRSRIELTAEVFALRRQLRGVNCFSPANVVVAAHSSLRGFEAADSVPGRDRGLQDGARHVHRSVTTWALDREPDLTARV